MAEKYQKKLRELTGKDLSTLFDKLKEDDLIFKCTFEQIAKHFLGNFLSVNTFAVDFDTLRVNYEDALGQPKHESFFIGDTEFSTKNEVPTNDADFYKYICKLYFDLSKEPKGELLELYERGAEDIRKIDSTLALIEKRLEEITKRNNTTEIQEKKPIFKHYQQHNEKARQQILNFILHEIKVYALSQSYNNSILSSLMGRVPYNYQWNPKAYTPALPNDLANKFGNLVYSEFLELNAMYGTDKNAFNEYLHNYIIQNDIVYSITDLLDKHHLLAKRSDFIAEALAIYGHGAKIMFASAVPTIIEGILHDLCLLTGESENQLLQKGFQYKLDYLEPILGYELHYEYYSFRFRIFRNKVAHGRLTKDDVDELADLLLLDLYQISNLAFSTRLKLNQKRFVINELYKNLSNPNYKCLIEYLILSNEAIPDFYNIKTEIEEVEKLISTDEFWDFLEYQIDNGGEYVKHGIIYIVKIIAGRKPFDTRCTKLFKKAGISKPQKELANDYINYLTKYY